MGPKEGARQLYAGFRLESDVRNKAGQSITSQDLYYSKEEFAQFIEDAAVMGVEVVPEIDTPAHSLALTKVFPKLGLSGDPESVDQLDLSNPAAQKLAETIWSAIPDRVGCFFRNGDGAYRHGRVFWESESLCGLYESAFGLCSGGSAGKDNPHVGQPVEDRTGLFGAFQKNSAAGMGYGLDRSAGNV